MTNEKVNCIDYIERAVRLRNSAYELLKFWGFFFLQNNTYFQNISLVSNIFKLFRKLTSRGSQTRFHNCNLSL